MELEKIILFTIAAKKEKMRKLETGAVACLLGALAALAEDSSVFTHLGHLRTACNSSSRGSDILFWPPQTPELPHAHTHTETLTQHINKNQDKNQNSQH